MGAACTFKDGEESSLEGLQSEYYGGWLGGWFVGTRTFVHAQALLPNSPSMHAMQLQWQNNNGPYQFINYRLKAIGFNYITVSQALTTQCHSTPGWPKISPRTYGCIC